MKKLVIIGARALGRETCNYAKDAGWVVKGFLDDDAKALASFNGYPPVIGVPERYEPIAEDVFVCAVGDSRMREKYVAFLKEKKCEFVSVIHPTVYIGPNVKMDSGCIVCPNAIIDCDVEIGSHVVVNALSYIPHDCRLNDFSTVSPGCHLGGRTVVGHGAFLGLGVNVIPDMEVGDYAYVAAGSTVVRNVPAHALVAGVPAKYKKEWK